jgi:hypothetical protein
MTDPVYQKFVKRWQEVTELPPQQLGPLTPIYHTLVKRFKVMPWPALIIISIVLVVALYLLIGSTISIVVSILQRGF